MNREQIIDWFRRNGNVELYTTDDGQRRIRGFATVETEHDHGVYEDSVVGNVVEKHDDGSVTVELGPES